MFLSQNCKTLIYDTCTIAHINVKSNVPYRFLRDRKCVVDYIFR